MLAAHRNGGRTSLASFARAWDRYTGAKRPRPATRREVRTLRSLLESSLAGDDLARSAARSPRWPPGSAPSAPRSPSATRSRSEVPRPDTGERHRAPGASRPPPLVVDAARPALRGVPGPLAAAEEQLAEQRAAELLEDRPAEHLA